MLQTSQLVQPFPLPDSQKEALDQIAHDVMLRLLAAKDARDRIAAQVAEVQARVGSQGLEVQAEGRFVNLPAVLNLQTDTENFLREAKLFLGQIARVFTPFYGTHLDHRFQRIRSWAERTFGKDDPLTSLLDSDPDWVERVIAMRNAVEHPGGRNGTLVVKNIALGSVQPPVLVPPSWGFAGAALGPVLPEMDAILQNGLTLFEDLLCACLEKVQPQGPFLIIEVPDDQRDPKMPIRLRVALRRPIGQGNDA
jgi:hypothetical protein